MAAPTRRPACRLRDGKVSIHGAANGGPDGQHRMAAPQAIYLPDRFQSTVPPMAAPTLVAENDRRALVMFQSTVPPMAAPTGRACPCRKGNR